MEPSPLLGLTSFPPFTGLLSWSGMEVDSGHCCFLRTE